MSRNDSVSGKPTKEFEEGWERIWGNKNEKDAKQASTGNEKPKKSKKTK